MIDSTVIRAHHQAAGAKDEPLSIGFDDVTAPRRLSDVSANGTVQGDLIERGFLAHRNHQGVDLWTPPAQGAFQLRLQRHWMRESIRPFCEAFLLLASIGSVCFRAFQDDRPLMAITPYRL